MTHMRLGCHHTHARMAQWRAGAGGRGLTAAPPPHPVLAWPFYTTDSPGGPTRLSYRGARRPAKQNTTRVDSLDMLLHAITSSTDWLART